ncbi:O-antigen ligase family protein [Ursidibacter sp. B-7004-1]
MLTLVNKITHKHITFAINILVALFFVTVLAFKKGYSYVPMTLAVVAIIVLFVDLFIIKNKVSLKKSDKLLIYSFLFYFLTFLISFLINNDKIRVLDNPARSLLFLPLIVLFIYYPINIKVILHIIPIGSLIAGLTAIYQKFYINKPVFYEYMSIQAGDISMTLGVLSIVITLYLYTQNNYKLAILYLIFAVLGINASVLAGTRGAWISIIITLPLIFLLYKKYLNKLFYITVIIFLILFIGFSINSPIVKNRINLIQQEYSSYIENNNATTSIGARLDMWKSSTLAIIEKPIFGWGADGYSQLTHKQAENKIIHQNTTTFNTPHNQFLDAGTKRGVIGILGLLAIFFVPLIYFYKRLNSTNLQERCIGILGIIHILSTMIYCLTQSFLSHSSGSIFYIFLVILLYSNLRNNKS